jgi:hypothetical protein
MQVNETFNSSVEAVTHDSDPKNLLFTTISQDPSRLFQRGETVLNPQGPEVDLAQAHALGEIAVPGTSRVMLGDLTGGVGNKLAVALQSPTPVIQNLTTGNQHFAIFDDVGAGEELLYFNMDADTLKLLAAAQGASGLSGGTITVPAASLDLQAFVGRNIGKTWLQNIGELTIGGWASVPPLKRSACVFTWYLHRAGENIELAHIDLEAYPHEVYVTGTHHTIQAGDEIWFQFTLAPADPVTVDVPIDAASIIAGADPGALSLSSGTAGRYGTALLAPYAGYTVNEVLLIVGPDGGAAQYGPVRMVAPSGLTGYFESTNGDGSPAQSIDLRPSVSSYQWPTPPGPAGRTVTADSAIKIDFNLRPNTNSPDIYEPLLVTEPYEIRTRNQAAFRFSCVPPFSERPGDYTTPKFAVWLFGSQGEVDGQTLWTRIPFNVVGANGLVQHATEQQIDAYPFFDFLPDFWDGTTVIFDNQEYATPWNYVRFLILPVAENDVSGYVLSITANAREL